MAALTSEPFRGAACSEVAITLTPANNHRAWVSFDVNTAMPSANQATWEGLPGAALTLRFRWQSNGTGSGQQAPTFATVRAMLPGGAQIGTDWNVAFPAADTEVTRTFHFDDDPMNAVLSALRSGMVELYLVWGSTGGLTPWSADSRGATTGTILPTNTVNWARGKARASCVLSSHSISNVAIAGAEPASWGATDPIHTRIALSAVTYRSITPTTGLRRPSNGTQERSGSPAAGSTPNKDTSWTSSTAGQTAYIGAGMEPSATTATRTSEAKDLRFDLPSVTFGGDNEFVWVTDDAAALAPMTPVGSVVGATVKSGFGRGFSFNPTLRYATSGISIGAPSAFSCEFWFKASAVPSFQVVIGGERINSAVKRFLFGVNASGTVFAVGYITGSQVTSTGTTNVCDGNPHWVEVTWTGTRLRVRVDGVQESDAAMTSLFNPAATTFWMGRVQDETGISYPNFDFEWDELHLSRVSRQSAVPTVPLTPDGNTSLIVHGNDTEANWLRDTELSIRYPARITVDPRSYPVAGDLTDWDNDRGALFHTQVAGSEFFDPPSSGDIESGQRVFPDVGFLGTRLVNARGDGLNAVTATIKTWDAAAIGSSESSPAHTLTRVTETKRDSNPQTTPQAGWLPQEQTGVNDNKLPLTWSTVLGGTWRVKAVITSPSALVGTENHALSSGSDTWDRNVFLVVTNPNFIAVISIHPENISHHGSHLTPEDELIPVCYLIDQSSDELVELVEANGDNARIKIVREHHPTMRMDYFDFPSETWVAKANGATIASDLQLVRGNVHTPGPPGPGDVDIWTSPTHLGGEIFAPDGAAGELDSMIVLDIVKDGVHYSAFAPVVLVGSFNKHNYQEADEVGFLDEGNPSMK